MWVFGYGSLMVDGWEEAFDGARVEGAVLPGYRRSFNKASTKNWGTPDRPGPTLGLEPAPGAECLGCAFRFGDERVREVRRYLREREGAGFDLELQEIRLPDGERVRALVAVNDREHESYIGDVSVEERAAMIEGARGPSGTARHYLTSVRAALEELGIRDARVEALWEALEG